MIIQITYHVQPTIEEETDRKEGKGLRGCLGDLLECRISNLAARMIWRKVVHPFLQIILVLNLNLNLINSMPQTVATTFAFSSVCFRFLQPTCPGSQERIWPRTGCWHTAPRRGWPLTNPLETRPLETRPLETRPLETRPLETHLLMTHPQETLLPARAPTKL